MTNSQTDKSLDEILDIHLNEIKAGHNDKLKCEILALKQKWEREAILKELKRILNINTSEGDHDRVNAMYVRIKELGDK